MFLYIVFFSVLIFWFIKSTRKPRKFPPGPPKLPLVGSIPFLDRSGSFVQIIRKLADEHGKVSGMFLGPKPTVIIADYQIMKDLFKKEELSYRAPFPPTNENRPGWKTVGKENEGCTPGVIGTGGTYWREQRRFLLRNLKDFGFGRASMESIIQDEMAKLCSKIAKFPQDEPVDLNRTMNISILNALWSILVGERLDLDDPKLAKIIQMFDQLLRDGGGPTSPIFTILPTFVSKLPGIRHVNGMETSYRVFKAIGELIDPYIESHQRTLDPNNIRDFLDLILLEIQNTTEKNSSFYGETGYYAMVNDLMDLFIAGMETTSTSLMWTFLFLLHHPEVQTKIHNELDEIVGQGRFPSLEDRPSMPYMNAVLLESFRTATLVPPGVPHFAVQDIVVGDYVIPKNTTVFGSLYHAMNDPKLFPDPHSFKPERFLDESGRFVNNDRVIPFGIGKRVCLGQTLAEKEFYIFFAGFMQQFEIQRDESSQLPSYKMEDTKVKGILRSCPTYKLMIKHRLRTN